MKASTVDCSPERYIERLFWVAVPVADEESIDHNKFWQMTQPGRLHEFQAVIVDHAHLYSMFQVMAVPQCESSATI